MNSVRLAIGSTVLVLAAMALAAAWPYQQNITSLVRINQIVGEDYQLPAGTVVFDGLAGYDGQAYYQMARDLPAFFGFEENDYPIFQSAYRWSRPMFAVVTYVLSFGHEGAFAWVMTILNIVCIALCLALLLRLTKRVSLHAMSMVYNPASLVGVLYALTEPFSLLCTTGFLYLFTQQKKVTWWGVILLTVGVLTREMVLLVAGGFFLVLFFKRRWKECAMLTIPVWFFLAWMAVVALRMNGIPTEGGMMFTLPAWGIVSMLLRVPTLEPTTLAASAFFLLFFAPLLVAVAQALHKRAWFKDEIFVSLLASCALMLLIAPHSWGSITSIGRVIMPVYPLYAFFAIEHDSRLTRLLSAGLIVVSVLAAIGMIVIVHPYTIR